MDRRHWLMPGAVVVLLSGCAGADWAKADATEAQTAQDARSCEHEASREALLMTPLATTAAGRGTYTAPMDAVAGGGLETARLTSFCMRAKGYALVPSRYGAPDAPSAMAGGSASPARK